MNDRVQTRIALILGKQGSGKSTRVLSKLGAAPGVEGKDGAFATLSRTLQILGNHYNHIAYDDDGDLVFVKGVDLGKAACKVKTLRGTYALEFPHSAYIPPGSNRYLNDELTQTKIFHLELPEATWRSFGGSTGAMTSPEYFMAQGRRIESRQDCDYAKDLARIRDDIARSGVPALRFDSPESMIEPIRDFLLFSASGKWTEDQLRCFIELKMGKTRLSGHQGAMGLLGYQVVDFGNGMRSEGDTQTPAKVAFLIERGRIPVKEHTFLDLGCNMGSVIFELKKRGAAECVGFDVYEPALEIARTLNEKWFQFPDARFLRQSIVDDWSAVGLPGNKVDFAFALSVLHKEGVRARLHELMQNLGRFARNLIVEIPLQPSDDAKDWDYAHARNLLEQNYVVERLPDSDFHSASPPRSLLLCKER